ncbi:MAG: hypothetical protein H6673_14850 [Anaerolineales bacterium]|nr:hypothetical protein [Anaerolineales bacterium]
MTISSHPHLNPTRQRLLGVLLRVAFVAIAAAILGMLVLGIGYGLFLMIVMIPFLLALSSSLLLLACLHPSIEVHEGGLTIKPLVFKKQQVAWEAIEEMVNHSLMKPVPPKHQNKAKTPKGQMLLIERGALPWPYRIVGLLAGHGYRPVIAIGSWTHRDYDTLRRTLEKALK